VTRWHRQAQRWRMTSWALSGALCLAPAHKTIAQAVYKVTDADGTITFTDTPPISGNDTVEEHSVQAPNSVMPPPTTLAPAAPAAVKEPPRYNTQIVTPTDNATIPMGPGNFAVQPRGIQASHLAKPYNYCWMVNPSVHHSKPRAGSLLMCTAASIDCKWFALIRAARNSTHRPRVRSSCCDPV